MHSWNGFLVASALTVGLPCATEATGLAAVLVPAQEGSGSPREDLAPLRRPKDADALFAHFARLKGLEAEFVEEKHLALLVEPLESRGRIHFLPPAHLTRIVESPSPSRLTIGPRELRMSGPEGEEVLDLRSNEAVRVFVTSLVRVFAGDRSALEPSYAIEYWTNPTDPGPWILTLTPRAKPLTEIVKRLRVHGSGGRVTSFEVEEPNGDRTLTRIVRSDPGRTYTDEEKRALFGIEPPARPGDESGKDPR